MLDRPDFARFCCFLAGLSVFGKDLKDPDYEWNDLVPEWSSSSDWKGVAVDLDVVWSDLEQMLKVLTRWNPQFPRDISARLPIQPDYLVLTPMFREANQKHLDDVRKSWAELMGRKNQLEEV